MATYRSTKRIEAMQWQGENVEAMIAFAQSCFYWGRPVDVFRHHVSDDSGKLYLFIRNDPDSGYRPSLTLQPNDWLIMLPMGDIDMVRAELFAKEWEAV